MISASNVFRGALPGMNLTAKQVTEAGKSITVTAENDINGITGDINSFISAYNDAMEFIDKQFSFNQETKESGVLITEALLRSMQTSVRLGAIDVVGNLESDINALATIGIRTDAQGSMRITDATLLQDAIKNNTESLQKLFGDSISGNRTEFQLISAASETRAGANNVVDITQAARQASYEGTAIADPALQPLTINSGANTLKLRIGSVDSEGIVLTAGTYTSFTQLVKEIQTRIDADDKIGARNLVVSFTKTGDTGRIKITGGEYGSNTTVDIVLGSSDALETSLGLKNGDIVTGLDVAGTINGEKATGSGQTLTGNSGNKTTDGLKLKITLTESDIVTGSEGVFTLSRGVASRLKSALFLITDSINGSLSSRVKALDSQVSDIKDQVKRIDERLALRRESLVKRFLKMEQALNQFNAQGAFLTSGLAALSRSFGQ
ncbi:MAG: flagellar filament capping protein FliD [Candidatus Zixiibacteriota bacterium]